MAVLPATRGPENGRCNICGDEGPLTKDHTPPKGCVKPTPIILRHAIDALGAEPHQKAGRLLQDGVWYRTLCSRCNSGRLGDRYDPTLIEFTTQIVRATESGLLLQSIEVKTRPQRLVRSIFGHIAAQGVDRYLKGPHTEDWAAWFLDESSPMPDWASFRCWLYPYRRQAIRRDAVITNLRTRQHSYYWLLKFYPVAFCIWHGPAAEFPLLGADISRFSRIDFDEEAIVSIPALHVPHELTLEAPRDDQVILLGQEAVSAIPRDPKGTVLRIRGE